MILQNMMVLARLAKYRVRQAFFDERGEVNIVAIVVLIGIAVLLALIFKDQIVNLLETLFGTITDNANNAVGGGAGGE